MESSSSIAGGISRSNHHSQDEDGEGQGVDPHSQGLSIPETSRRGSGRLGELARTLPGRPQARQPGPITVSLNNVDDPLKKQHTELVKNGRRMAKSIVRAHGYSRDVDAVLRRALEGDSSGTSVEQMAQYLHEWSAINSAFREAILDTKDLATRCAGFVSVFLSVCLPSTGRADALTLESFKNDNTLPELHSMTEVIHGKYTRIAERMAKFKEDLLDDGSHQSKSISSMVGNAEKEISRIVNPLPQLSTEQTALLDNSSIPGLMVWIVAFLPKKSISRIDEFIEGGRANISQGDTSAQLDMKSSNLLTCLLDIGYMIPADLSVVLKSPLRPLDQKKWDYTVKSTYAFLEYALKEFDESLSAAITTAQTLPAGRWWWTWKIQPYFQRFRQLMQNPLRDD